MGPGTDLPGWFCVGVGASCTFKARPKEPLYEELSRTTNVPGPSFFNSSMACSRVMFGLNQNLEVSITNFMVGCMSLMGPSGDVENEASGRVWLWLLGLGPGELAEAIPD